MMSTRRITALFLAFILTLGLFAALPMTAYAAAPTINSATPGDGKVTLNVTAGL